MLSVPLEAPMIEQTFHKVMSALYETYHEDGAHIQTYNILIAWADRCADIYTWML